MNDPYGERAFVGPPARSCLRLVICFVCLTMKPVGEPDAGNPHVRFDERGWETERCRMAEAIAPVLNSTRTGVADTAAQCLRYLPSTGPYAGVSSTGCGHSQRGAMCKSPIKRRSPLEAIPTSQMTFPTTRLALCAENHSDNFEGPDRMRS
jgi:hypothetical protein